MTVFQRTPYLPRKLPGYSLAEASVADDVVQHLPSIHVFKDHVVVVLVNDHLSHSTDIRVVQKHGKGGFTKCPNLLGSVFGSLA
jgi:hypothetical protein